MRYAFVDQESGIKLEEIIKLEPIINNILNICNDCDIFTYLREDGYQIRVKEELGSGAILSALGLFSAIGLLSKIYKILSDGYPEIDNSLYEIIISTLKSADFNSKEIRSMVRKPRKSEINETDAFVKLVKEYPVDFGLKNLSQNELQELWDNYRNNLVHALYLGNDSLIIETSIANNGSSVRTEDNYFQMHRYKKKGQNDSFTIISEKEELRGKIVKSFIELGGIDLELLKRASCDEIKIDNLIIDVREICTWLLNKFKNNEFELKHVKDLRMWLTDVKIYKDFVIRLPM